ncbi:UNVERIFIED_ORG: hypothetical protein ABIB52_001359 [Arthrobacter sp. UYCu721]
MVLAVLPKRWPNWYESELRLERGPGSDETGSAHNPARIQRLKLCDWTANVPMLHGKSGTLPA